MRNKEELFCGAFHSMTIQEAQLYNGLFKQRKRIPFTCMQKGGICVHDKRQPGRGKSVSFPSLYILRFKKKNYTKTLKSYFHQIEIKIEFFQVNLNWRPGRAAWIVTRGIQHVRTMLVSCKMSVPRQVKVCCPATRSSPDWPASPTIFHMSNNSKQFI